MARYPVEGNETYQRLEAVFRRQNNRGPNDLDKATLTQEVMRLEVSEIRAMTIELLAIAKTKGA
jgi:hypothetical protein